MFDLWAKDAAGKWGKSIGTVQGKIRGVEVRRHHTKVWRAVPAPGARARSEL